MKNNLFLSLFVILLTAFYTESRAQAPKWTGYYSLDLQDTRKESNANPIIFTPKETFEFVFKQIVPERAKKMKFTGTFTYDDLVNNAPKLATLDHLALENNLNAINVDGVINTSITMDDDMETYLIANTHTMYLTDAQVKKGGYLYGVLPSLKSLGKVYHNDLSGYYQVLTVDGKNYILFKADCLNPPTEEEIFWINEEKMVIESKKKSTPKQSSGKTETSGGNNYYLIYAPNNKGTLVIGDNNNVTATNVNDNIVDASTSSTDQTTLTPPDVTLPPAPAPDVVIYNNNNNMSYADQPVYQQYATEGDGTQFNNCWGYDGFHWYPLGRMNSGFFARMNCRGGYQHGQPCHRDNCTRAICKNQPTPHQNPGHGQQPNPVQKGSGQQPAPVAKGQGSQPGAVSSTQSHGGAGNQPGATASSAANHGSQAAQSRTGQQQQRQMAPRQTTASTSRSYASASTMRSHNSGSHAGGGHSYSGGSRGGRR